MGRPPRYQSKALAFFHDRYIGDDADQSADLERIAANAEVAQLIYDLRTEAGLSQRALAKRVGTSPSVISRLEDTDYEGHSLSMLRRIATALGKRVVIQVVADRVESPKKKRAAGSTRKEAAR